MPSGKVEIIEFVGTVEEKQEARPVQTYLLLIDGEFGRKRGAPRFQYLPASWRDKYQVESFKLGGFPDWRTFFDACTASFQAVDRRSGTPDLPAPREESPAWPPADASSTSTPASAAPPRLDTKAHEILVTLLDEPVERLISLKFEVMGYLALIEAGSGPLATADQELAQRLAARVQAVVARAMAQGVSSEEHRQVQAAVRYFTVAEDAIPDWKDHGYQDDIAVLNHVVESLGWTDLKFSADIEGVGEDAR